MRFAHSNPFAGAVAQEEHQAAINQLQQEHGQQIQHLFETLETLREKVRSVSGHRLRVLTPTQYQIEQQKLAQLHECNEDEEQINSLKATIHTLRGELGQAQGQSATFQEQIDAAAVEIADLKSEYETQQREFDAQIGAVQAQLSEVCGHTCCTRSV